MGGGATDAVGVGGDDDEMPADGRDAGGVLALPPLALRRINGARALTLTILLGKHG
jgi:hypothetical protein